ncbi:PilZ domain-containing protein [Erythrobacter litoralis]|jgi:hypothetical protein|uniref:PilZ domain-containing protein n=1 Tax=Erythrobacter litoralis TaxID=39960 RepID=A0A074NFP4_9SPHN|nr:PilZ domain-containing protein [Erythrobacter litoralis]AOL24928.1 PilZ domain-containing protein [Erythrobacter litoralis]KEO96452.1 hypothetical protein EH32_09485 [Erythrobacter litoralis]MEE4338787.1 PilZ domain-containing protein [Erythrobacter sp.]
MTVNHSQQACEKNRGQSRGERREERRIAARGRLVLRIAKLVCETGEYACILRDVSLTGAGLSFFHEVPPDMRPILQLSNGHTFPVELVWSGAGRAGYRFAVPVAEEDFIAGDTEFGHRPLRLSIRAAARIVDGCEMAEASLVDLSAEGAKLEVARRFADRRVVSLALAGRAPRLAEVRWQTDEALGLRFFEPLPAADLASLALALQPFAAPAGTDEGIAAIRAA